MGRLGSPGGRVEALGLKFWHQQNHPKTESCFEAWALRSFLWEGVRWGLVGGWLGGMELL